MRHTRACLSAICAAFALSVGIPGPLAAAPPLQTCIEASLTAGILSGNERVTPPSQQFAGLLNRARELMLKMQYADAFHALQAADRLVPCLEQPVSPEQFREMHLRSSTVRFVLGHPEVTSSFSNLLTVAGPDALEGANNTLLRGDFDDFVAQAHQQQRRVDIRPYAKVWIDGLLLEEARELRTGRHLVQLESTGRPPWVGAFITIPPGEDTFRLETSLPDWMISDLRSPLEKGVKTSEGRIQFVQ